MPLYQDHAEALTAYNEIAPALKEAAYADVKSSFEALAAPLMHIHRTDSGSCRQRTASPSRGPKQESGAGEE
ncbi:hypothetical protein ACVII1_004310 [Bradyrhizobium elkanii]|jgi:hypothetical protein|uniref:Uncharacterized protein n=1 Tax=Bradyrhizobium elkanii TaxID=29448 RepID=A0ABV4EU49_BRAEL|nr:hypothetical protein [Bradyrhizobium elkanii]MCP1981213.1 hypothetical protein [Bradyrhizobium elkanii]MCS3689435.1 hypothetical protein [Bradyrhizobium elkanii]MCS3884008.1 hypothetical protein [Bradyrhizobium elkanii]MCS4216963.1 hypothetical protein [Bradyrhizobium elkanii]